MSRTKKYYPPLEKNGDLAELMGVVLGDGHICVFPRTECLSIFSNSDNHGFVERYSKLMDLVFNKRPVITKRSGMSCIKLNMYQKDISKRLEIPSGSRRWKEIVLPTWIEENDLYIKQYLRGLYEAEGSHCVHLGTYTHKFLFSNRNQYMLNNVLRLMTKLGFHPHKSACQVQLSRKNEVYEAMEILQFRKY